MDAGTIEATLRLKDEMSGQLDKALSALEKIVPGFGVLSAVAGVSTVAVGALSAAVIALGRRGSDVNDVADAFESLSAAAGGSAKTNLDALSAGVGGLLTNVDLMTPVNRALGAGLKLTTGEMGTMARAAWVLADANKIGLKEAYDSVTAAMGSGRGRALESLGVMVEQKGASNQLKAALSAEGDEMTTAAQKAANRSAIMAALTERVKAAGAQELDFGEKLDRVHVWLSNFNDQLASAVAKSPVLAAAMDSIGASLAAAFGKSQSTQVEMVVGWIEKGSIGLIHMAQMGVLVAAALGPAFTAVGTVVEALAAVISGVLELAIKGIASVVKLGTYLPGVGDSMQRAADATWNAGKAFEEQKKQSAESMKAMALNTVGHGAFHETLGRVSEGLSAAEAAMKKAQGTTAAATKETSANTASVHANAQALSAQAKAAQELAEQLTGKKQADEIAMIAQAVTLSGGASKITAFEMKSLGERLQKVFEEGGQLTPVLQSIRFQHILLNASTTDVSKAFEHLSGNALPELANGYARLIEKENQLREARLRSMVGFVVLKKGSMIDPVPGTTMLTSLTPPPKRSVAEVAFGMSSQQFGAELGGVIQSAMQGGGSIANASAGFMGQKLATNILGKAGSGGLQDTLTKYLGGTVGGALGSIIPGLGALVGPLVGAIFSKIGNLLAGGEGHLANQLRDGLKKSLGGDAEGLGLDKLVSSHAGVDGVLAAYEAFNKGGSQKQVQKAADDLKRIISESDAVMGKYGLTLEMIKSPTERLAAATRALGTDYTTLKGLGFGDDTIAKGMASGLNDAARAAINGGAKIPEALKPVLDSLIRGGALSDDLARKLLGLPEPNVVPWKDMASIAEEFGISLDALGPKFRDSKLIENGTELAAKWSVLASNGADLGAVIEGFTPKAQEFLTNALKWGTEIPASMRPMLTAMAAAGALTDATGEKLTDLSGLNFAADLSKDFQLLIDKLDAFIDRLTGPTGVAAALNGLPSPTVRVGVEYDYSGSPPSPDASGGDGYHDQGFARGGIIRARAGGKRIRVAEGGKDEVVAPVTDLATIIANAMARTRDAATNPIARTRTTILEVNGRVLAEVTAPELPDVVERLKLV